MAVKRFYKNKLYKFKLDGSIYKYHSVQNGIRTFEHVLPVYKHISNIVWSPTSTDDDYELYKCKLLEILLGL